MKINKISEDISGASYVDDRILEKINELVDKVNEQEEMIKYLRTFTTDRRVSH
jgi:uncharacterized protein YoxC